MVSKTGRILTKGESYTDDQTLVGASTLKVVKVEKFVGAGAAAGRVMVEVIWTTLQVDAADVAAAEAAVMAEEATAAEAREGLDAAREANAEDAADGTAGMEKDGAGGDAGRAETSVLQATSAAVRKLMEENMVVM